MATKVIVVDDSRSARLQISNALTGAGYSVVEAVDGLDGLSKMSANPDAGLVLCDVNMPNMCGLDMLAAADTAGLRAGRRFLMLTTETHPELMREAMLRGAEGWIVKPFKPERLVAAVQKLAG
jgi:two-component system, chemotaxis family, chemotaxis protein CheY